MSIFGKMDAADIPTNPYFIEKGEYAAEVSKAMFKTNREDKKQIVIEYTIDDPSSQFDGNKATQYFTLVDDEMSAEAFALLPGDEQKAIRRNMSALKRTLCGNESNSSQKGLGVDPDDLNDETWNPEVLVGTKVDIGISNYGPTNEGVNVRWVNLRDE